MRRLTAFVLAALLIAATVCSDRISVRAADSEQPGDTTILADESTDDGTTGNGTTGDGTTDDGTIGDGTTDDGTTDDETPGIVAGRGSGGISTFMLQGAPGGSSGNSYDHIDVKTNAAITGDAAEQLKVSACSVSYLDAAGQMKTLTMSGSSSSSEWTSAHGLTVPKDTTISITFTLTNGKSYTSTLDSDSVYPANTRYNGDNASKIGTYFGILGTDGYYDISGKSVFLISEIVCNGSKVSQGSVSINGLDLVVNVETLLLYAGGWEPVASKVLLNKTLEADEVSFNIYESDSSWGQGDLIETAKNDADGSVKFSRIPYTTEGTYYYLAKETVGSEEGITYDNSTYQITVTVTKDSSAAGRLNATAVYEKVGNSGDKAAANGIIFTNSYFVANPDYSLEKSITSAGSGEDGKYLVGETVTYQIKVKNTGNVDLSDIEVEDRMTGASGTISFTDTANVTWKDGKFTISKLETGKTETITYTYKVTKEDAGATITNTAVSGDKKAQPEDPVEVANPDYSLEKSITSEGSGEDGKYKVGETVSYRIEIVNTGNVTLTDVAVKDKMTGAGGAISNVSGAVWDESTGTFTVDEIKVEGTAVITYEYVVIDKDAGKTINNIATSGDKEATPEKPVVVEEPEDEPGPNPGPGPVSGPSYSEPEAEVLGAAAAPADPVVGVLGESKGPGTADTAPVAGWLILAAGAAAVLAAAGKKYAKEKR